MTAMTPNQLRRLFPNASEAVLAANNDKNTTDADNKADNPRTITKLERDFGNGPLAAGAPEKAGAERVHIRFVSVRKRLCDPDNISEKWLLDAVRYIGLIDGDEPDKITLETSQRKAAKGEEEKTELTIIYP